MNQERKENGVMPMPLRVALAIAVLILGGLFLSRDRQRDRQDQNASSAVQISEPAASQIPASYYEPSPDMETPETESNRQDEAPTVQNEEPAQKEEEPIQTPKADKLDPIVYDAKSYQLVTDMVYAYKMQVPDRDRVIAGDVAALKEHNERLGETWGAIMDYWDYANTRMEINYDGLPEDLPQDDSLCIIVLGFQLEPDGAMSPEMHGRCEIALGAAEQYPNAYLAVTGGGTAFKNPEATEAGVMANWFLRKGIAEERLIREDQSSTTEENAIFTRAILTERYPQVKSLVIVSSDYHLPLGCLMFTEAALLYGCEHGEVPFEVVCNLALSGYGIYEYKNPQEQALYVWRVADPQLQN